MVNTEIHYGGKFMAWREDLKGGVFHISNRYLHDNVLKQGNTCISFPGRNAWDTLVSRGGILISIGKPL